MDNDFQDKYMDAVLAMLMDEYAEAEAEVLLQKSKEEIPEEDVPEELDKKCQALIRKKFAQKKRRQAFKVLGNISKRVAVFAIVLLGMFSALFLTVDAIRTPVINFYLKNMGNHSVLVFGRPEQQTTEENMASRLANMDKLTALLPSGYSLIEGHFDEDGVGYAYFANNENSDIRLGIMNGNSLFAVDTEDCDKCERLSETDIEGYYIEKGDRNSVMWLDNSGSKIFTLASRALEKESLLQIAISIQLIEDTNS